MLRPEVSGGTTTLRCDDGHAIDVARSGYVHLGSGSRAGGDGRAQLRARRRFLERGHYAGLARAVAAAALARARATIAIGDFGCGEGYYADAVLRAAGEVEVRVMALDSSKDACDLAARRLGRGASVAVADCAKDVPVMDGSLDVVLSVFAPRSPSELARVLRPGGRVVIARANEDHMQELHDVRGEGVVVLGVERDKGVRVDAVMRAAGFSMESEIEIRETMSLSEDDVVDLIFMGPSGHHASNEDAVRRAVAGASRSVTSSFVVSVYVLDR